MSLLSISGAASQASAHNPFPGLIVRERNPDCEHTHSNCDEYASSAQLASVARRHIPLSHDSIIEPRPAVLHLDEPLHCNRKRLPGRPELVRCTSTPCSGVIPELTVILGGVAASGCCRRLGRAAAGSIANVVPIGLTIQRCVAAADRDRRV